MAGVDREYRIRIQTVGDPSGAQAVAGALEKTTGATQEATKATEKHGESMHALHRLFHSLNEVVPGLGVAMQAAFSPIGATISLAVMAVQLFREHISKLNEEFKQMEEAAAKPLTNRLQAMRDSVVSNATGMAALHDRLADAARGEQNMAAQTEHAAVAMRQQIGMLEALGAAQKSGELELVENLHAAGLLREEEYVERKLAIEQAFLERKRALEERQEVTEMMIRRRALERAEMDQPGLTSAAGSAEANKEKALTALGSLDRAGVEERRKTTEMALREYEQKIRPEILNQIQTIGVGKSTPEADRWMQANGASLGGYYVGGSKYYAEWDRLKRGAMGAQREWEQFPGEEAKRKVAADTASRAADTAAKRAEENEKFTTDATRDLEDRRRAVADRRAINAQLSQDERDANTLKTPIGAAATQAAAEAAATAQAIIARKPVTAQQTEQLREAASVMAGHSVTLQEALQMMQQAKRNNESMVTTAVRLADGMLALIGDHSALKGRVALIERALGRTHNTLPGN